MGQRRVGERGPAVSPLGLGTLSLEGVYGSVHADDAVKLIHKALDLGVSLIDVAGFHAPGPAERLVGRALASHREEVVLAVKFGARDTPEGLRLDGSPGHAREACDASLRRLGVEHIDIYYLRRIDPDVPVEETVGAMGALVAAGKVRHIGLSEVSAQTLIRAHAVHPLTALQTEYALWERHVEREILPTCRELGIGFVAYSPLGRGFLTGRFTRWNDLPKKDIRRQLPRFQGANLRHNQKAMSAMRAMAEEKDVTCAQLALAWSLSRGKDIIPIFGTADADHLKEDVAAADLELTAADTERLDRIFAPGSIRGDRHPARPMRITDTAGADA
jgi:aryl-alcohol dehydrogenase-like predicted oxidoreductase